jgi:hypothetical protein
MVEPISLLVEGVTDEAAVTRLVEEQGRPVLAVYGRRGKSWIDGNISKYNSAAKYSDWIVLRDLDNDAPCAGQLVARLLPVPSPRMRLRVAVHQLEAWLLGDIDGASTFFGIARGRLPTKPETVLDPKRELVRHCRSSRLKRIREGMVPASGSTASVGPEYASLITEFSLQHWNWKAAAAVCDSLQRFVSAIGTL